MNASGLINGVSLGANGINETFYYFIKGGDNSYINMPAANTAFSGKATAEATLRDDFNRDYRSSGIISGEISLNVGSGVPSLSATATLNFPGFYEITYNNINFNHQNNSFGVGNNPPTVLTKEPMLKDLVVPILVTYSKAPYGEISTAVAQTTRLRA
jgi:hypothetical protein